MVHVAKVLKVGTTTVAKAIKDLGMRSYVRRVRALISAKAKVKRVERSIDLQEWLLENPNTVIIFSDKKIFTGKPIQLIIGCALMVVKRGQPPTSSRTSCPPSSASSA